MQNGIDRGECRGLRERNRRCEPKVQNKENNMASINFRGKQSPTLAYNGRILRMQICCPHRRYPFASFFDDIPDNFIASDLVAFEASDVTFDRLLWLLLKQIGTS